MRNTSNTNLNGRHITLPLRDLLPPLTPEEYERLKNSIADFGYVDAPPEGCPPRRSDPMAAEVSQIVNEVVQTLRGKGIL